MKAIWMTGYGGPEVLEYVDAPRPIPGTGEVLVRVKAIGVNPVDYKVREGRMRAAVDYTFPLVPGYDFAGVVDELGPGTTGFARGDAVLAMAEFAKGGAYAEFVAVDATLLGHKPPSMSFEEAAATPMCSVTAETGIASKEGVVISKGQTLLIQGGASNVGAFAIQFAKERGARVAATCSTDNVEYVRSLGADEVIDYTRQSLGDSSEEFDAVFDLVGGAAEAALWQRIKRGGDFVTAVGQPSPEKAEAHGVRHVRIYGRADGPALDRITPRIAEGTIKVLVGRVLPLSKAADAQRAVALGHGRGKVILAPET